VTNEFARLAQSSEFVRQVKWIVCLYGGCIFRHRVYPGGLTAFAPVDLREIAVENWRELL
jgi:hypothetical protein